MKGFGFGKIAATSTGVLIVVLALTWGLNKRSLSSEAQSSAKFKIRWVLAHEPVAVFERAAKSFKSELEKTSHGEIEVEILTIKDFAQKYKGGVEFSPYEVFNKLKDGDFEMSQTYTTVLGKQNPKMWVLDLPFLFRDHEHATKVLEGPIGQRLMAGMLDQNVRGLTFTYSGGFRVIPTVDRELRTPEDFKGLMVNVSGSPVASSIFETLGAHPIQLTKSESEVSLQKGTVDALETTYVRYTPEQRKAAPILNETHHSLFLTGVIISEAFYQKLPVGYQDAIRKAALQAGRDERAESISDGNQIRATLEKDGVKLVAMTATETERLKVALSPVVEKYRDFFGADLIASIQNEK